MCKLTEIWRNLRVRTKVQLILLLAIALVSAVSMHFGTRHGSHCTVPDFTGVKL